MDLPQTLIENNIDRGTILHSTMFKNIDHGKFFAIIGISEEYVAGFFFINSNINILLQGKQEQMDMQYPLRKSDYDFLKYDSFLCATNIMTLKRSEIADTIKEGITEIVGVMKKEHIEELLEKARKSILFSKRQREQFLY